MTAPEPIKHSGNKPGSSGPGIVCHHCKAAIAALTDLDEIPDPFRMKCPKCGHDDLYHKHEIRVLTAHRKQ